MPEGPPWWFQPPVSCVGFPVLFPALFLPVSRGKQAEAGWENGPCLFPACLFPACFLPVSCLFPAYFLPTSRFTSYIIYPRPNPSTMPAVIKNALPRPRPKWAGDIGCCGSLCATADVLAMPQLVHLEVLIGPAVKPECRKVIYSTNTSL